jgi:integration host factor subunit alpha
MMGFGKFQVKHKKSRTGRNQQTDMPLQLRERKVVIFKCSGMLNKKQNGSI